ncbi:hypothetical protein IAT38_000497 [Cryptococcus sp. DSM 104549]
MVRPVSNDNLTNTGTPPITTLSPLPVEIQHLILDYLIHICPSKSILLSFQIYLRTFQTHWSTLTITSSNCHSILSSRTLPRRSSRTLPRRSSRTLPRRSSGAVSRHVPPDDRLSHRFAMVKHVSLGYPGDDSDKLCKDLCRARQQNKKKLSIYFTHFPNILTLHISYSQYDTNRLLMIGYVEIMFDMIPFSYLIVWDIRLRTGDEGHDKPREGIMWWMMHMLLGEYSRSISEPARELDFHIYPPADPSREGKDGVNEEPPKAWCKVEWRVEGEAKNHQLDERVLRAWIQRVLGEGGAGQECSRERLEEVVDRSIDDLPGIAETLLSG